LLGAAQPAAPSSTRRVLYANLGATLVLHSVLVDGLQKLRHFKNAGEAALSVCGHSFTLAVSQAYAGVYFAVCGLLKSNQYVCRKRCPRFQHFCLCCLTVCHPRSLSDIRINSPFLFLYCRPSLRPRAVCD
jgi:hypothetical protein